MQTYKREICYLIVILMMKRVGAIYNRDASKSKDRTEPLRDLNSNLPPRNDPKTRLPKRWKLEIDNVPDSESKNSTHDYYHGYFETDCREISFNESKHTESVSEGVERRAVKDREMVEKLGCLNAIIREMEVLKGCGLKSSQAAKLGEIEDRLLGYERKLLQL